MVGEKRDGWEGPTVGWGLEQRRSRERNAIASSGGNGQPQKSLKNQRPQPPPGSQGRLLHPGDLFGAGLSRGTMCFPVYRGGEFSGCVFFEKRNFFWAI
jgi:hypothetical protein